MAKYNYCRPLNDKPLIERFLSKTLEYNSYNDELINKIKQTEIIINHYEEQGALKNNTYLSDTVRNLKYRKETDRWALRKKIVHELINKTRLPIDDKIRLGKGGALPNTEIKKDKEAFFIIGLPASGKSGVSNEIADITGSIIVDSDYAKRKFPEFHDEKYLGAYHVHKESSAITFGDEITLKNNFKTLISLCYENSYNIVLPRIGSDIEDIYELSNFLKKEMGYKVHLVLINLDKRKATIRALDRFIETDRYIPIGYIFDSYSNECQLTYYRLKNYTRRLFTSFSIINTDVPKGSKYSILEMTHNSPLQKLK